MRPSRDPYAAPPAPHERGGPILRFAVVLALLGAAAWAYLTFSQGPGLTTTAQQEQRVAQTGPAVAVPAVIPEAPPPAAPASSTAPQPQSAPPASTTPPG